MPVFEYQCKECDTRYEVLHKSSENKDVVNCPECKSTEHIKLISAFSSVNSSPDISGCSTGSCGMPSYGGGCQGGMCGLN
ncbi:MAG: zinc ribbon domain-containing protein [Ignavibacteriae bacterium]|nr:zinc ribbon domain-containing protein [Ignavibacteriota bacterium]